MKDLREPRGVGQHPAQIRGFPSAVMKDERKGRLPGRARTRSHRPRSRERRLHVLPRVRLAAVISNGKELSCAISIPSWSPRSFGYETGSCPASTVRRRMQTPFRTDSSWSDVGPSAHARISSGTMAAALHRRSRTSRRHPYPELRLFTQMLKAWNAGRRRGTICSSCRHSPQERNAELLGRQDQVEPKSTTRRLHLLRRTPIYDMLE